MTSPNPDQVLPPNTEERLLELFSDSPLNDEPLTPEQEERLARKMAEPVNETEEEFVNRIRAFNGLGPEPPA